MHGVVALRNQPVALTMGEYLSAVSVMPTLIRLDDLALLLVEGPDALTFLQGQVTCDVKNLSEGAVTLGALCNPKGRAIAVFRLFRHHGRCDLLLRSDMIEAVGDLLRRYVLRAKVTISDAHRQCSVFGLLGELDGNSAVALGLSSAPPEVGHGAAAVNGAWVLAVDRDRKYLILAPNETATAIQKTLAEGKLAVPGSPTEWERADIRDGVPSLSPATSEEFIPQMLNLDLLGGIGFNKGCYTGQEVVARTHYLGAVKRRMQRFRVSCSRIPEPGARIACEHDESPIGQVVSVVEVDDFCYELLAVVTSDRLQTHSVRLWSSSGPEVERLVLPYLDAALARDQSTT